MTHFFEGFIVGILLSAIGYISLNLLKFLPSFSTLLDINDNLADIDVKLQKISQKK